METNFKMGNLKKFPSIAKLPGIRDRLTALPAAGPSVMHVDPF